MYFLERETAREQLRNTHSAIADVGICAMILDHICQQLSIKTIEDLCRESERARTPTTMPYGKHKGMLLADVHSDYKQWLLRADIQRKPLRFQEVTASKYRCVAFCAVDLI